MREVIAKKSQVLPLSHSRGKSRILLFLSQWLPSMVGEEEASLTIRFAVWGSLTATLVITSLTLSLF